MKNTRSKIELPVRDVEVVLGACGVKAPAHIGLLRCLEEKRVNIGRITCASGGCLIGLFKVNGYNSHEIEAIFTEEGFRFPSWDLWAQCLHLTDPWNWFPRMLQGGFPGMLDFGPWLEHLVKEYDLKPHKNLRLVASDFWTHEAIYFEGPDIDLVRALKASTAVVTGLVMEPVLLKPGEPHNHAHGAHCNSPLGHYLVDGFYHHPEPADLCDTPAIVSKVGFASKWPSERLPFGDLALHMRELVMNPMLNAMYPDHPGNLTINVGPDDVASLTFGISQKKIAQMVEHAYCQACRALADQHAEEWLAARRCVCSER